MPLDIAALIQALETGTMPWEDVEFGKGNISLSNRPIVKNVDNSISTVLSKSFNFDGVEVLIPTISDDRRVLTDEEAIAQYKSTGKFLGKFSNIEEANRYAQKLHLRQQELYTSSISIIENENVANKTSSLIDTYDGIGKQTKPKTYADMARLMDMSMKAPQEYKERMGTVEFTLKGVYSLIPERSLYAAAEGVNKLLAAGFNLVGMKGAASYFDKLAEAIKTPPVTKEYKEEIALLLADAKEKGKFQEATASLGYAVTEALAYLVRMALVKSIPGIGAALPMTGGIGIPGKAAQLFTGVGTLGDIKRHAALLGGMGMLETPGDITGRMQGAVYRIAYNITPFIANATPFTGWGARATDTMLNMFLSSPSYVRAFQTSKDAGEFFVKAIPEFASDVIFALKTTGSPMNQRLSQMGKIPSLARMTRNEKIAFINKADELSEPRIDYGAEIKPSTDRKVVLETMKDVSKLDKLDKEERSIHTAVPKFPQKDWKVTNQKSLEKLGNAIAEVVGLKETNIEWKYESVETISGAIEAVQHVLGDNRFSITLKIPKGYKAIVEYPKATAGKLLAGKRASSHGTLVKIMLHELGHIVFPIKTMTIKELVKGGAPDTHRPAFHEWTEYYKPVLWKAGITRIGVDLKTETFDKLVTQAEKAVEGVEAKMPKAIPKAATQRALQAEMVNLCINSMEKSGKAPDYVNEKIVEESGLLARATGAVQTYVANMRLPENLAGYMDRQNPFGANWKVITGDINDAENARLRGVGEKEDAARTMLQTTYGEKKVGDVFMERHQVGKFSLSDSNVICVYMGSFDKGALKHIKQGNNFTDKDVRQCVAIVEANPKLKEVASWLSKDYSDDYPFLARAYKEETGKDLPKLPFYMHLPVDFKSYEFEKNNVAEQMMQRDRQGTHAYVTSGIVKERVPSNRPIGLDAVANYLKYVNESEHYKAFAHPVKNLTSLLRDPKYKAAVRRNMNEATLQTLNKYARDISGTRSGANSDIMDRMASGIRRHTGTVVMGMNILSGFRAPLSGFNAAAEIGPYWMLHGIARVAKDMKAVEAIVFPRSAQIEYRAGQWERFQVEAKQTEKAEIILTKRLTPSKVYMGLYTYFDKLTVLAAAIGTYDKSIYTGRLSDGERIPNDDLERVSIMEMERVNRKTQPYAGKKDMPGWHRGGIVAQMFTQFQTQVAKNVNYIDYDIVSKLKRGKITPLQASQKFLFSVVLPAMILGMIARGRLPTKKEAALDVLKYPVSGLFFVGSMINTALNDFGDFGPPLLMGPIAAVKAGTALTKKEWEKVGKYGIKAGTVAANVPYSQLYRTYKGTLALMRGETDDWRRLIWSEYALTKGLPALKPRPKRKGR